MRRSSAARSARSRRSDPPTTIRRRSLDRVRSLPPLLAAALVLAIAACGSPTPSPSAVAPSASPSPAGSLATTPSPNSSGDLSAEYARIEAQVEQLRELTAKSPVHPTILDEAALKKNIAADFAKNNPPKLVAATQQLFELMGLVPADSDLAALYVTLLGSQVAGYYDPDTKQLYVVSKSGALGPTEQVTFAHEYTHALQDQNFGLGNLQLDAVGQGDTSLARLSLVEGDATLLMAHWAQAHLTPQELVELIQQSTDPEQAQILAGMPQILRETLLFPYTSGLQFVLAAQASGGWSAVDAIFGRLPSSTEQILHADKYASAEKPIPIEFPEDLATRLGTGWSVDLQDTLGEFQLRVWLESAGGLTDASASPAAAGWGGDRVALVSKGDRAGAVIDTRWDSASDARAFADAAQTTLAKLTASTALIAIDGTNRVTIFLASDEALVNSLASALGLAG